MWIINTAMKLPSRIVKLWLTIVLLPIALFFVSKVLNTILTVDVMNVINNCLNAVDYLIGSKMTNILLSIICFTSVISFAKRINKLLNNNQNDAD